MDNSNIAEVFRTAARNGFIQIDEATATEMADFLEGAESGAIEPKVAAGRKTKK